MPGSAGEPDLGGPRNAFSLVTERHGSAHDLACPRGWPSRQRQRRRRPRHRRCCDQGRRGQGEGPGLGHGPDGRAGQGSGGPGEGGQGEGRGRDCLGPDRDLQRPHRQGRPRHQPALAASGPARSLARSRAAIPVSSCSKSSDQAGRTARRPRSAARPGRPRACKGAEEHRRREVQAGPDHRVRARRAPNTAPRAPGSCTTRAGTGWSPSASETTGRQQLQPSLRHQAADPVLRQRG